MQVGNTSPEQHKAEPGLENSSLVPGSRISALSIANHLELRILLAGYAEIVIESAKSDRSSADIAFAVSRMVEITDALIQLEGAHR